MLVIFSKQVGDERLVLSDGCLLLSLFFNDPVEHCLDLRHVISESIMDCNICTFFATKGGLQAELLPLRL